MQFSRQHYFKYSLSFASCAKELLTTPKRRILSSFLPYLLFHNKLLKYEFLSYQGFYDDVSQTSDTAFSVESKKKFDEISGLFYVDLSCFLGVV